VADYQTKGRWGSYKTVAAGDQTARQSMEEFKDAGEVT